MSPAPSVSISPSSAILDVGQSRLFTSSVTGGISPYTYQWYLNGTPISGAMSANWTFTPSSSGSCTLYLEVTDAVNVNAMSNTANVTVNRAPSVSISPSSAILDLGQSRLFTSSVTGGIGPYSYQWYLNGVAVSGATKATWTYTPHAAGLYTVYVKVTDSVGMQATSNKATVIVNLVPSVKISPSSAILDLGQSRLFTSSVTGGIGPYSYQWYLNGVAVSGATKATWTYTPHAAGLYTVYVKVTDSVGMQATSNKATVIVLRAFR
jgi:hypothetical protein